MSPYLSAPEFYDLGAPHRFDYYRDHYVARGYAVALAHTYGMGNSRGCHDLLGPREIDGAAAVVEWLGEQPWSTRRGCSGRWRT